MQNVNDKAFGLKITRNTKSLNFFSLKRQKRINFTLDVLQININKNKYEGLKNIYIPENLILSLKYHFSEICSLFCYPHDIDLLFAKNNVI